MYNYWCDFTCMYKIKLILNYVPFGLHSAPTICCTQSSPSKDLQVILATNINNTATYHQLSYCPHCDLMQIVYTRKLMGKSTLWNYFIWKKQLRMLIWSDMYMLLGIYKWYVDYHNLTNITKPICTQAYD